jgi:hypothetical protein
MSYYIYKICCDDCPDFVYVGSTKAFRERKAQHKMDCNNENRKGYNRKLYNTIRDNGGWENWRMVIIEECGDITFTQARIREEEHRVKLNANLNSQKCQSDNKEYKKEWYEKNKEEILEKHKDYKDKNKEKISEWSSQKITCECGCKISNNHSARHKKSKKHIELMEEINKN